MKNKSNYWSERHKAFLLYHAKRIQQTFSGLSIDSWDLVIEGWFKTARYRPYEISNRAIKHAMVRYVCDKLLPMCIVGNNSVCSIDDVDSSVLKADYNIAEGLEAEDIEKLTQRCLSLIPSKMNRALVVSHYKDGMSYRSIAKAHNMHKKTVETRVRYALRRVRKLYSNQYMITNPTVGLVE